MVEYSAGLLAAIFQVYGIPWLIPIIPFVSLSQLALTTFCATDPPAVVALTTSEANALLRLQFGTDFNNGLAKVSNLILNTIWHDACQCNTGTAAPFVPPAMPSGTQVFQPPLQLPVDPCVTTGPLTRAYGITQMVVTGLLNGSIRPTWYRLTATNNPGTNPGTCRVQIDFCTDSGPLLCQAGAVQSYDVFPNQTLVVYFQALSQRWFIRPELQLVTPGADAGNLTYTIDGFCGGSLPGTPLTQCCEPSAATQSYLDAILNMVTLIQRQNVPFGYLTSTAHPALTGAGSFAISGLLGVRVDITGGLNLLTPKGTSPPYYFGGGFITFGVPDGFPSSYRVKHSPQLMMPARCSAYTVLDYDLPAGVTITVTELVREP